MGYSVPIVLFMGLAAIAYSSANKLASVFRQVELTQETVDLANNMALIQGRIVMASRGYLLSRNPNLLREYQYETDLFNQLSNQAIAKVENPEQKKRIEQMIVVEKEYEQYSLKLINLVKQGKANQAMLLFQKGQGQTFVNQFKILSAEFNKAENIILTQATSEAKSLLNNLIAAVVIGALLCLAFSLIAAFWISAGITLTINLAASAIAASSNEIATTVEEQERTASQQATSVNETTTTMDELGASSQQAAGQAQAALAAAQKALDLAAYGTQAVEETLGGMSDLKLKVGAIALEISRLSEQTYQIGSISSLVSNIANQTNMLALNAAVEAVRAGEHGKGFGVVASEIRKLADQSKKSTERINALVGDIQNAINSTVMVTDEGTKTVEINVKSTQKTADAFTGVTQAINNVVLSNQQISLSAKQQAIAIEQVIDAMNSLNHAASETATGISQTRIGTQKLNEAAQSLKAVV